MTDERDQEIDRQGVAIRHLVARHVPVTEIADRMRALGHELDAGDVRAFVARHRLVVAKDQSSIHSIRAIELGLVTAAAETAGTPVPELARYDLESEDLAVLARSTSGQPELQRAAGLAAAALGADGLSVSFKAYNAWRDAWLAGFPKRDRVPWPVTAQTVLKRVGGGYWNGALRRAGLVPSEGGRPRGNVFYTEAGFYDDTMVAFIRSLDDRANATVAAYERWAVDRDVPSSPSIRNHYGSWSKAQRLGYELASRKPLRRTELPAVLLADSLIDQFIDQVGRRWQAQDEEIAAAGTQPATVGRALRRACEELASEDVRLFERFRREWLIAAIEEDPQGFHANLEPEGRATKRERADWTSLAAAVVDEAAIRAVLDDRVLDGLLSARADLRDDGGWLAPGQRARLERADESDVLGWRVLKAVRNILTHDSDNALGVLRTVMDELGGSSSPLAIERSIRSKRDAIAWLANDAGPAASGRGSRLSRSRLAVLHGTVIHVAASMRSEPLPG